MNTGVGTPFTRKYVSNQVSCPANLPNYLKTKLGIATEMSAHVKCAQYWPNREEREAVFDDTNFKLSFVSEDIKSYYTVRQLELKNQSTQETREILHFHYTTWPDFGVPESPASFLNFLFQVRESGCLSSDHGPVVVHCSAGIGRSGTFCLVDTCLLLMSMRKDPSSVRIRDVLLEMRRYRMGLIQTPDQLRFSYLAVIEGAKYIMGDTSLQESWKELSNEEDYPPEVTPPPPNPRPPGPSVNGTVEPISFFPEEVVLQKDIHTLSAQPETGLRWRGGGGDGATAQSATVLAGQPEGLAGSKEPAPTAPVETHQQHDTETHQRLDPDQTTKLAAEDNSPDAQKAWSPLLANVCLCTALALGAYVCYRACFQCSPPP
uniref:Tyrosine-protein phosphatase non-receptor type n=1 Tax=Esox lucius TaxID=8010 RepID=A0A3P9AP51_ESOLU